MSTEYAKIPIIHEGVVFSDPSYDENVWCQYRKDFNDTNWLMKLDTRNEDGCLFFDLYLGRPTVVANLRIEELDDDNLSITFPARFEVQDYELGIDTAEIFCGQKENWDAWAQEGAICTGADGMFGSLTVFTCKGETAPAGFLLMGSVDGAMIGGPELFQHLCASFNGTKIREKEFAEQTNIDNLVYKLLQARELRHSAAAERPEGKQPNKSEPER